MIDTIITKERLSTLIQNPSASEFTGEISQLTEFGLREGFFSGCDGFLLEVQPYCCTRASNFHEFIREYVTEDDSMSSEQKLNEFRGYLKGCLESPEIDEMPSFHHWQITTEHSSAIICAIVDICGHEPVARDFFAVKDIDEIPANLRASGYLISEGDIDALSDQYLLNLWSVEERDAS